MNSALNAALCYIMLRNEKAHNKRGNLVAMSNLLLHFLCMKSSQTFVEYITTACLNFLFVFMNCLAESKKKKSTLRKDFGLQIELNARSVSTTMQHPI